MTPRLTYRADGKGHLLLEVGPEDHGGVGRRYVTVHRLAGVAWGLLDGLEDPREVHHRDVVPCHNAETNLEALPPEKHGAVTRENERERAQTA